MRYTAGRDGYKYASVRVIVRLSRGEVDTIREHLKEEGKPHDDKAIREHVIDWTEYRAPASLTDECYDRYP